MDTLVNRPFSNLKELVLRELKTHGDHGKIVCFEINLTKSPFLNRGGSLKEFGNKVNRIWKEE